MIFRDDCAIEQLTLDSLSDFWAVMSPDIQATCPFVHPAWLMAWWDNFGKNRTLRLLKFERRKKCIGIAPMMEDGEGLRFIGSPDLCDYHDMLAARGEEKLFLRIFFRHFGRNGTEKILLGPVREDSSICRFVEKAAQKEHFSIVKEQVGATYETRLDGGWEKYLSGLSGKQRHEVRRKIRRLEEAGDIAFHSVCEKKAVEEKMDTFFRLFKSNRPDKADFMTPRRASFFADLASETAKAGMARLFFLHIDDLPAAASMCFDFQGVRYLYNNGYDAKFRKLSVGILSKVFSIKDGADTGLSAFSFLKGEEAYKERMGGEPVRLFNFIAKAG